MNRLTDRDILEILNSYNIKINGIYQKDKLPNKLLDGIIIVNLQSSVDGSGSHWSALFHSKECDLWYDPFGFLAPEAIEDKFKKSYYYNKRDIQHINSSSCGFFCIAFAKYIFHKKNKVEAFDKFIDLFSGNTKQNEKVLYDILYNS
jgi:hypothetical protein